MDYIISAIDYKEKYKVNDTYKSKQPKIYRISRANFEQLDLSNSRSRGLHHLALLNVAKSQR
jgi:hypothetical protein